MDYKNAGVDIEAGYKAVELMKRHVKKTYRDEVLTDIGGFGGLFSLKGFTSMKEPVLVSGTDGVGTKLKLAFLLNKHDTIGIDCVAMCINDIICSGASPLFFLDYIACGKNTPEKIEEIVKGVAEGCQMAGAALIGGETAEMPDFYPENEYDLAGFAVGIVDRDKIIDGSHICEGDILIGVASSGLHSNGYSLVRKILRPSESNRNEYIQSLGQTLGDALLTPTKIYVKPIASLIEKIDIKGMSNITGGGFIENIPRMLNKGLCAEINEGSWPVLPVFELLQKTASLEKEVMYNTFNMGIGIVIAVDKSDADNTLAELAHSGEKAFKIGRVIKGEGICLL